MRLAEVIAWLLIGAVLAGLWVVWLIVLVVRRPGPGVVLVGAGVRVVLAVQGQRPAAAAGARGWWRG